MADVITRVPGRSGPAVKGARRRKAACVAGCAALALALAAPGVARAEGCQAAVPPAALAAGWTVAAPPPAPTAEAAPLAPELWAEIVGIFARHGFDIRRLEHMALQHGWPVARDVLRSLLIEVPFARQVIEAAEWTARHRQEIVAFGSAVAEATALLAEGAALSLPAIPSVQEASAAAGRAVTLPRWVRDGVPAAAAEWGRGVRGLIHGFEFRGVLPW